MRELENVFAYLYCDDGKSIIFGEYQNTGSLPYGGYMLKLAFKVKTSWCEAIGWAEIPSESLKKDCADLKALTDRIKPSVRFSTMYGNLYLDFTVNRLGNFEIKGEFGFSEYDTGQLTEEFQTHEAAIVTFRRGIEAVLAESQR